MSFSHLTKMSTYGVISALPPECIVSAPSQAELRGGVFILVYHISVTIISMKGEGGMSIP